MKKSNSISLCLVSALILAGFTAAHAEEQYRTEVSASYTRSDYEGPGRSLANEAALEFFLAPVTTDNHPYAEAAYLEKIGSIGFSVANIDYNYGFPGDFSSDYWSYNLFLNYKAPDSPLIARVEWDRIKGDFQWTYDSSFFSYDWKSETKQNIYSIAVGAYLSGGLSAVVGYRQGRMTSTSTSISTYTISTPSTWYFTSTEVDHFKEYSLNAKYVKTLSNGTAFNLEASALQWKSEDELEGWSDDKYYSLGGDFYFTRRLSAGVSIGSINGSEGSDGKIYIARLGAFITPTLSLSAGYERFLNDVDGEPSVRNYSFTLAARF